jgi:hypothetical protein
MSLHCRRAADHTYTHVLVEPTIRSCQHALPTRPLVPSCLLSPLEFHFGRYIVPVPGPSSRYGLHLVPWLASAILIATEVVPGSVQAQDIGGSIRSSLGRYRLVLLDWIYSLISTHL